MKLLENYDTNSEWEEVKSKQVPDSDGFLTDYTWYTNGDIHIFMFGDKDIYTPDRDYADWECDTTAQAQEWFDSYNGFEEESDDYDEDDLYESFHIKSNSFADFSELIRLCKEIGITDLNDLNKLISEYRDTNEDPLDTLRRYRKDLGDDFKIMESVNDDYEGWDETDIAIHKFIDWKARNYEEYPIPEDSFMYDINLYSTDKDPEKRQVKFIKYIRANPIYPPYYAPEEKGVEGYVGPMYDGDDRNNYDIHNRYDTQELYDMLSR